MNDYVALERTAEVLTGETRTAMRSTTRLVPVRVRSIETKDELIPLVEQIELGRFEIRGVTPVLASGVDPSIPHLEEPEGLELVLNAVFGLIRTQKNHLNLADLGEDDQIELPLDSALVGVIPAPPGTFEVTAYDIVTDQDSKLGYHFNGTAPKNWVEIALRKRETTLTERKHRQDERAKEKQLESERTEREAQATQKREAEKKPVQRFETADREVAVRLREAYLPVFIRTTRLGGKYLMEDPEHLGQEIANAAQTEREQLSQQGIDPDKFFEKRRQEHAEALAAR